jgi:hypothetical protein
MPESRRSGAMPRYFFNLYLEGALIPDPEGLDLTDPDEAWETARATALDLMTTEFQRPVDWFACHIEVRDSADDVLLEFPFTEAVEVKRPPN